MKLFEIISPRLTDRNVADADKLAAASSAAAGRDDMKQIGTGFTASAFTKLKNPHAVLRVSNLSDGKKTVDDDAYLHYAKSLRESNAMASNPYFPRLYDIRVYNAPGGRGMFAVEMEKLTALSAVDNSELAVLAKRMFVNADQAVGAMGASLDNQLKSHRSWIIDGIAFVVEEAVTSGNMGKIKDPMLAKALRFIAQIKGPHQIDIHGDNIMARRGPHGLQLVITDPLF